MPVRCAVAICKNKAVKNNLKSEGISYHLFPRDKTVKQQWIEATGRGTDWRPMEKNLTICSEHFELKCYQKFKNSRRLFGWAVPTLKLKNPKKTTPKKKIKGKSTKDKTQKDDEPLPVDDVSQKPEIPECEHDLVAKEICTKCKKEFEHKQPDINFIENREQSIIANVYHFLEKELKQLKNIYGGTVNYTPFQKLKRRTAEATGVCLNTVRRVLEEEEELKEKQKKLAKKRRINVIDSSSEDNEDYKDGCENNDNPSKLENKSPEKPLVLNVVMSEEEYFKINNIDADDTVVELETENVEFEFLRPVNQITNQPVINCQPLVITEPQFCSLEPINPVISQTTGAIIDTQPLVTVAPQYCSLTLGTASEPSSTRHNETQTDTQYCSFEPMGPMTSQPTTINIETQWLEAPNPQYCSPELMNPMLSPSICTQMESPPLMPTAQLFCGPALNGSTIITSPNLTYGYATANYYY